MKNKMLFILNSVKQSVINKPFAFVLLILIFFATTICCSLPSRYLVACLNFVRSEPNSMFFEVSPDYFKQNNVKIGDYIRNNCNNLAFEDKNIESDFFVRHYESSIIFNDKAIKFKEMRVRFVVKQSFGITDEDISTNQNIVCINEKIAMEHGIEINNTINFYGNNLIVKDFVSESINTFVVPYNLQINEWYSCTPPPDEINKNPKEREITGHILNLKHSGLSNLKNGLKKINCKVPPSINAGILVAAILDAGMLLICLLSSLSIMGYWLKCNNKKYATYKTLGCKPSLLGCAMIIETLLIAIFAISLGVIVDYFIGINMVFEIPLASFAWLHYLLLIGGTFVSAVIMATIAIVRRAIAMPANTKYNV